MYDLTVLGVTGYTGKLVAKYLNELKKRRSAHLPNTFRVCFAGRDLRRVKAIADSLSPDLKPAIVAADLVDEASVYRLASDSKVILSCVVSDYSIVYMVSPWRLM